MSAIELNTDLLAAAYSCVSTEETRYYLKGVFVTPAPDKETGRGVLMVATDGHRMALVWDENGTTDRPRILQLDAKSKALKRGRGEHTRVLHLDNFAKGASTIGRVCYAYSDAQGPAPQPVDALSVHEVDGSFPDWTRVLPQQPDETTAVYAGQTFNAKYLASFSDAFKRALDREPKFSIAQSEPGSAAWIWCDDAVHMRFVVMPVRASSAAPGRPFWIGLATDPQPEAMAAE